MRNRPVQLHRLSAIAVGLATGLVALSPVRANPSDPFGGVPSRETEAPQGDGVAPSDLEPGADGSFSYSFPIALPPGRNGMAPSLALSYSSAGALRGGVAVGWSMELPHIEIDPAHADATPPMWIATLNGASGHLVPVTDDAPGGTQTFRMEHDDLFARFEATPDGTGGYMSWTVRMPSGRVLQFTGVSGGTRAFLSRDRDADGNEIDYSWQTVSAAGFYDYVPTQIQYTANANAGLGAFAKVDFVYAPLEQCPGSSIPIGASVSHREGRWGGMHGSLRLTDVIASVRDTPSSAFRQVRDVKLGYDANGLACGQAHAPLRYLTRIVETVTSPTGVVTSAPATTFTYGPFAPTWSATKTIASVNVLRGGTYFGSNQALMDMNGDGILDYVTISAVASPPIVAPKQMALATTTSSSTGGSTTGSSLPSSPDVPQLSGCVLHVQNGLPGGGFAAIGFDMPLPSADWGTGGGFCTLDRQHIGLPNVLTNQQTGATMSGAIDVVYQFVDWDGDGRTDVLTALWYSPGLTVTGSIVSSDPGGTYHTFADNNNNNNGSPQQSCEDSGGQYADGTCACGIGETSWAGGGGACMPSCWVSQEDVPGGGALNCVPSVGGSTGGGFGPGNMPIAPSPEKTYSGAYRWRVFAGNGGGFGNVVLIDAPIPMSWGAGETAYADTGNRPQPPLVADIDGDGLPDVTTTLRDSTGMIVPVNQIGFGPATKLLVYKNREPLWNSDLAHLCDAGVSPRSCWAVPAFTNAYNSATALGPFGTAVVPGTAVQLTGHVYSTNEFAVSDIDGDGFPDFLVDPRNEATNTDLGMQVLWNGGANGFTLGPVGWAPGQQPGYTAIIDHQSDVPGDGKQELPLSTGQRATRGQGVDVDGDGIPDRVGVLTDYDNVQHANDRWVQIGLGDGYGARAGLPAGWDASKDLIFADNQYWQAQSDVIDVTGDGIPDLVTVTGNATVTIQTEPDGAPPPRLMLGVDNGRGAVTSVSYATSTDPSVVNLAGQPMPQPRWVVKSIQTAPGSSQPTISKSYTYASPMRGAASRFDAPTHFLGFAAVAKSEADASGGVGRQTLRHYAMFDRMRVSDETISANAAPGGALAPISFVSHSYETKPLLDGSISFTYESSSAKHVCAAGENAAACAADTTNLVGRGEAWAPSSTSLPRLYLHTASVETAGGSARGSTWQYQTVTTASDYHVVLVIDEKDAMVGGVVLPLARTTYENFDRLHPQSTVVWSSSDKTTASTTTRSFDAAGNVVTVRKPNQGAAGLASQIAYDLFDVYPLTTTNELKQVVITIHDLGTGALVTKEGPNSRTYTPTCVAGSPSCGPVTAYETESWTIDGFGRPLSHSVPTDPPGGAANGYASFTLSTVAYNDGAIPNTRTTTTSLDYAGRLAPRVTTESFDGLGRAVGSTATGGSGSKTYTTTYAYDPIGGLQSETLPDPQNDAATVTYSYSRDGLGRVVKFMRPDGSWSGITYGALDSLVQERSPNSGDGIGRRTRFVRDVLGRLVNVLEYDNPTPGAIATSTYAYDGLDRPISISDADGMTTTLAFDWQGRRTAVTRGSRNWIYGYDADGNVTSRQTPLPSGATAAQYTSTTTYDALDRVATHTPATRGLASAAMQPLDIGKTTFTYDLYANGVGSLSAVKDQYGYYEKVLYHDVHHDELQNVVYLHLPSATTFGAALGWTRSYTPAHQIAAEKWEDGSQLAIYYDFRDQPSNVQWLDQSLAKPAWKNVAVYDRSVAGPPRARASDYGQARTWRYDHLGRVTYDRVYLTATGASKSERTYGYDGFGELRSIGGENDGLVADVSFDYDAVHRLKSAVGPGAYNASFTYSAAGNVQRATIAGADTPNRDASYAYGAVDPQAVDRLVDFGSGATIATMQYDAAGNLTQKTAVGRTAEQLVWDGDDLLRQVQMAGTTVRYFYDETGKRIAALGPNDVKVWIGDNEIHYSTTGTQTTRWLNIGKEARVQNKTQLELAYSDALESTMISLDANGATQGSFLYGAFGEVVAQVGAATHPVEFDGKSADADTGLRYYGARYYDPYLLRWTGADPLYRVLPEKSFEQPQRGNWYAFTLNNPIRYVDPDGRDVPGLLYQSSDTNMQIVVPDNTTSEFKSDSDDPDRPVAFHVSYSPGTQHPLFVSENQGWEGDVRVDRLGKVHEVISLDPNKIDQAAGTFQVDYNLYRGEGHWEPVSKTTGTTVSSSSSSENQITYRWVPGELVGSVSQKFTFVPVAPSRYIADAREDYPVWYALFYLGSILGGGSSSSDSSGGGSGSSSGSGSSGGSSGQTLPPVTTPFVPWSF